MNGCQFAVLMAVIAPHDEKQHHRHLQQHDEVVEFADSLMPTTSSVVTTKMMSTAGRLKIAVTWASVAGSVPAVLIWSSRRADRDPAGLRLQSAASAAGSSISSVPRAADNAGGTSMPKSRRNDTT